MPKSDKEMDFISLLLLLFWPCWAAADILGPELEFPPGAEECPLVPGCCEEDCCGPGTSYIGNGFCVLDPSSPGWTGTYSDRYVPGCVRRLCCEEDCCGEGTVFDSTIDCCVVDGSPSPAPTTSPAPISFAPASLAPTSFDQCFVEIEGPACICTGEDEYDEHEFVALGSPQFGADGNEGDYEWETNNDIVEILTPFDRVTQVRAKSKSSAADDVTLTVTYTVDGVECFARFDLTVIQVDLEFRATGTWSPENDIGRLASYGEPTLGPVRPGNPAGCTGFHKNIEIVATVTPCDDLPRCTFDFKREKQGYGGFIDANGGNSNAQDVVPPGSPTWDDDDKSNADEDLVLEKAEGCKLFVVDSPGIKNVGTSCTAAELGDRWYNFKNFREWLDVNGKQCTDYLVWRASTYIQCVQIFAFTYAWQQVSLDEFNANDVGEFDFTAMVPPPGAVEPPGRRELEERIDIQRRLEQLVS